MFSNRRKWTKRICLLILGMMLVWLPKYSVEASGDTKIHFISLYSTTDAILLESNGHYGMIDSGEDWDYPGGEDYPFLDGVTQGIGYEQQVIHYLREQGVEKLDFYIATHAHSDHIGSGDEILKAFPVDRLYINEYSDAYITDERFFWDNQYVYDCLIQTAQERGVQIVTDLDLQENESSRSFSMGNMQIEIMNYERERDESGQYLPVPNENCNSLVVKVTAFAKVALLTGDIDPWVSDTAEYGDTAKVANQLIDQLWTGEEQSGSEVQINKNYDITNYETYKGVTLSVPGEESGNTGLIDETKPNTEKTISLDLLKLSHHAMDYNNTTYFLTSLNPKTVVITGFESFYNAREKDCMPNARMFATATDSAAVVAEFREDGIQTEYVKMSPGWMEYEGESYYFDENGRTYTDGKRHIVDGKEYGFNEKGAVMSSDGWIWEDGVWRYWYAQEERFAYNEWIEVGDFRYYCDNKGKMLTGWKWIGDGCYYFNQSGVLERDAWIDGHYLDQEGKWVKEYSTASWRKSGNRWWYRYGNGGYASDGWKTIDHKKYYFDSSGWMAAGWREIDGSWYYFKKNGNLAVNAWIGDCYVDGTGVWDKEYTEDLWMKSGGRWWYRHRDGSYTKSDFEDIDGERYYFDENGWMVTGWKKIGEDWYYFKGGGALAADVWVGGCYVDDTGRWIQSEKPSCWMKSGGKWWYCHGDGSYTKEDFEKIENSWYYFDAGGWMVTGWKKIGEDWYYFGKSGAMKTEGWVGEYYLKANGKMAVDEWVANGKYYVDKSGICQYMAEALQLGKSVDNPQIME